MPNNTPTPNLAPLRRSQRTVLLATKVTPHFDITVRTLARDQGILITEMLEKLLVVYLEQVAKEKEVEKQVKTKSKTKK